MERVKMPRSKRAAQFAPFDALKGLQEALRLKEYEHVRVQRGEVPEEDAEKISSTLLQLENRDVVKVKYYDSKDEHYHEISGVVKTNFAEGYIDVDKQKLAINDIYAIENLTKQSVEYSHESLDEFMPQGESVVVPGLVEYSREELEGLSMFELRHHARMFGVKSYSVKSRNQLIDEMMEIIKETKS